MAKLKNPQIKAVVIISLGRVEISADKYNCFACDNRAYPLTDGKLANEYGAAQIKFDGKTVTRFLCEGCFNSKDIPDAIARKILDAPDMSFSDGGTATLEQVTALSEKSGAIEH